MIQLNTWEIDAKIYGSLEANLFTERNIESCIDLFIFTHLPQKKNAVCIHQSLSIFFFKKKPSQLVIYTDFFKKYIIIPIERALYPSSRFKEVQQRYLFTSYSSKTR